MLCANCLALFIKTCETGKSNGQIWQNNQIIIMCHIKVYRYKMTMKNLNLNDLVNSSSSSLVTSWWSWSINIKIYWSGKSFRLSYWRKSAPEVKDIRVVLLDPETILDIMCWFTYPCKKGFKVSPKEKWVFSQIDNQFEKLEHCYFSDWGRYIFFMKYTAPFLKECYQRISLGKRLSDYKIIVKQMRFQI